MELKVADTARDHYGFVYLTTNKINGKQYIGQKKIDKNSKHYLGSGFHLNNAINKYGKENFTREILEYAYNEHELNQLEFKWIKEYNAVNNERFYNMIDGGSVQDSLKRKNSIPVICINNQMSFKSIADAAIWAGCHYKQIKDSFTQRRYKGEDALIFRPLSSLNPKKRLCTYCGNNFPLYKKEMSCRKCTNLKRCYECKNVMKVNHNAQKRCLKCKSKKQIDKIKQ